MSAWATAAQAQAIWPDAKQPPADVLEQLLQDATEQLAAFAPAPATGADGQPVIPGAWRRACVLQAQELYRAASRDGEVIGLADYAVRARPLGATVRALLRPERAVPAVG